MEIKWIKKRLPKNEDLNDRDEVLITTQDHTVRVAKWSGSAFWVKGTGWCESTRVIAWAHMPEPYIDDSEELETETRGGRYD